MSSGVVSRNQRSLSSRNCFSSSTPFWTDSPHPAEGTAGPSAFSPAGAAVTAVGLAMIDESIRVLELPMMFESVEELDYVADKLWPYFQKKMKPERAQNACTPSQPWS